MGYQKIINLLNNTQNQPYKFRIKNWAEINDVRGTYNTNTQVKFTTSMLKSHLCDNCDAYILVKGTALVANSEAAGAATNNNNIEVIFKNCAPFTDSIIEIKQYTNR